jgi:hypothetical protein
MARLIHLDSTVIGWHSWRQADTAAMARNFHETGEGIFYPRADWGGGGYVETEFQLYTYTVSLLYSVFGVHEAIGRLVSVIMSLLAILGLYLLTRRFHDERTALIAATIYAVIPLSLFYGRAFMPEPTLIAAIIWGLFFFDRWRSEGRIIDGVLAWLAVTLAVLLKIPTLYIGLPLFFIAWTNSGSARRVLLAPSLWLFALGLFVITALWYTHAHSLYKLSGNTFGIWTGSTDKWGNYSSLLTFKFYNDVFFKSIAERHLTWPGMLVFIYGLTIKRRNRRDWMAEVWLVSVIVYILVVNKGNQVHEYYQLPFIPPAVMVMSRGLGRMWKSITDPEQSHRRLSIVLPALLVTGILLLSGMRYVSLVSGEADREIIEFADEAKKYIPENAFVLDVSDGNPVMLYLLHRKGWIERCGTVEKPTSRASYMVLHKDNREHYDCAAFQDFIRKADTLVVRRSYVLLALPSPPAGPAALPRPCHAGRCR